MASISSLREGKWPTDVGILAIEVYFPSLCVNQTELEAYDGAGAGKYTIGLGQTNMGFCTDREDIHSLSLTVVSGLLEKYNVSLMDIGRLEVGTETIVDKSKSVKTVLMQLFMESGNTNIEGIDTTNACYGGTQALFNAVSWVESSAWDGRFALVVTADIAVYASGNARPTGGAGAVAMLIGANAPITFERGLRAVHMEHAYDFYKPDLSSEYPVVDGHLSIKCYLNAVDTCYHRYKSKVSQVQGGGAGPYTVDGADYYCFHSPFVKLVQKSFSRLILQDFFNDCESSIYPDLESLRGRSLGDTLGDKDVEKLSMRAASELYKSKTLPTVLLGTEVGNMYTASLYGGLVSLIVNKELSELGGRRVVMFSYGSGLASALYSLRISSDISLGSALGRIWSVLRGVPDRLRDRKTVPPVEFERIMKLREGTHHKPSYTPTGDVDDLYPGTFYLTHVDEKFRRSYERTTPMPHPPSPPLVPPIRLNN
jgi:hydroxymethylglutaryl-CoA synthase